MAAIEARYAEALLMAAKDPEQAASIQNTLDDVCNLINGAPELGSFLNSPVVPREPKREVIKKTLPEASLKQAESFLCLLIDKKRIALLSSIAREYSRKRAALSRTLLITVTSPDALEKQVINKIEEFYKNKYGCPDARAENIVNPALLGGIQVKIGDELTDNSLAGRLKGLAAAMSGL